MRYSDVRFLSLRQVLLLHDEALEIGGQGAPGIRDVGLVESAVLAPQNSYGGSLVELAALYGFGITKNHGFVDGNKRTALYAVLTFLDVNDVCTTLPKDPWTRIFVDVASGALSRDGFGEALARHLGGGSPLWHDFELDDDP